MNVSDCSESPHLASGDFTVGEILPPVVIESVSMGDIPIEGSKKTNRRAVVTFRGAKKKWVMATTRAREIADMAGVSKKGIEKSFVGVTLQLVVVGGVKNPRGGPPTTGFRIHAAWPPGKAPTKAATTAAAQPQRTPEEEEERRIADAEKAAESAGEQ